MELTGNEKLYKEVIVPICDGSFDMTRFKHFNFLTSTQEKIDVFLEVELDIDWRINANLAQIQIRLYFDKLMDANHQFING